MDQKNLPYLTTLTPLRGIAAILVVVFHSNLMVKQFLPQGYTHLIEEGWLWVDFFFVLSGFIMFYVYGKKFKNGVSKSNFWKYVGARFARVYPLHLFTLILAFIGAVIIVNLADGLDPFLATIINPKALPASLVMLQGMGIYSTAPLNTPTWSLSTEWWMYMVFPFFVPLFARLSSAGKYLAVLLVVACYLVLMYIAGPLVTGQATMDMIADFAIFRCAAGFLLGMLLHEFYAKQTGYSFFKNNWTFIVLCVGVLIAMHFGANDLLIIAFFPLIILAAAYNESSVKKILDTRTLQNLGDWSFSIYMVHVPIAFIFWIYMVYHEPKIFSNLMELIGREQNYMQGFLWLCILMSSTLIVAALTYRYIELPSRNFLNARFNAKKSEVVPNPIDPSF